ncbi:NACHT, LRR and PYD domains-containing protein 1-like [Salvelinus sp. IW2-2015]|uniref:NACHT, LRR and PYD domains-containing protein 1-like n=1 Tax=Salvelinus sp. IW2-2015 TaxID=2691554 RepID=UPI0038D42CDD
MFRHRTPKGSYECTVSGLRWLCERDVILKYHFRNWEPYSQLLKDMQYTQGGPLLDITMELGELEEVHLPHFVCLGTNPSLRNEMKILHVEEHGVSLEEVHEVTRFHAKILHPKFSAISLILSYIFSWNVHCDVVLYLAVKRSTVISRLYLLLRNSSQKESCKRMASYRRISFTADTTPSCCAVSGAGGPAESSLTGSTEHQLRSVRTEFVKRVSRPVLNELLDGLLEQTVINQEEMESVKVIAKRAEMARDIIDMVLRKGNESCSRMINLLGKLDPRLWTELQNNSCSQPLEVGRPGRVDRKDGSTCSCCLLL